MSALGLATRGYLGGDVVVVEDDETPTPPTPVPVPVVFADPEYVDHVAVALSRLPQQFRGDPWRGW